MKIKPIKAKNLFSNIMRAILFIVLLYLPIYLLRIYAGPTLWTHGPRLPFKMVFSLVRLHVVVMGVDSLGFALKLEVVLVGY